MSRLLYLLYALWFVGFLCLVLNIFPVTAYPFRAMGFRVTQGQMDRGFLALFRVVPAIWLLQAFVNHRRGPIVPALHAVKVVFREDWASGRSYRRWWHILTGINNGLRVIVTPEDLCTQVIPPLSYFMPGWELGLVNRIPLYRISGVQKRGFLQRILRITYRDEDGHPQQLDLRLRKRAMCIRALEAAGVPMRET